MKKLIFSLQKNKKIKIFSEKRKLFVQGEKGKANISVNKYFGEYFISPNKIFFTSKSYFKTFFSQFASFLEGISTGYMVRLHLQGIGYRAIAYPDTNTLYLKTEGQILLQCQIPSNVLIKAKKQKIILFALDKSLLYTAVQLIKNLQQPNPYTGKGVRLYGETVKLKVGKQRNR